MLVCIDVNLLSRFHVSCKSSHHKSPLQITAKCLVFLVLYFHGLYCSFTEYTTLGRVEKPVPVSAPKYLVLCKYSSMLRPGSNPKTTQKGNKIIKSIPFGQRLQNLADT